MITFEVPGIPVAKARPRVVRVRGVTRTFTPQQTIDFENRVRLAAQAAGAKPIDGPVELLVYAFWPLPKSQHRKKEPRRGSFKTTKPDWDNIGKAVSDALNGIAYTDDSQVARATVWKITSAQGAPASVVVEVRSLREDDPQVAIRAGSRGEGEAHAAQA